MIDDDVKIVIFKNLFLSILLLIIQFNYINIRLMIYDYSKIIQLLNTAKQNQFRFLARMFSEGFMSTCLVSNYH